MKLYMLWGFVCIGLTSPAPARSEDYFKLHGEDVTKVEIEFDFIDGNALITYNNAWRTRGKILYSEKKKIVAFRDDEIGHCLFEKITIHKQRKSEHGGLFSSVHCISETSLEKAKAEKLAGKKLVSFCGKYPITLLKESSVEDDRKSEKLSRNNGRVKRRSDLIRGNESQLSHQEISKKLLDDLADAEGLVSKGMFSAKGVKRNVDGGSEHGHHPSASAKVGQPATVDYHARIRNNLPSGAHPLHPIDITSSVTIATGASHPVWSYSPSAGPHYPQNGTGSGQGISVPHGMPQHSHLAPSSQQNISQVNHHGHHHSPDPNGQTLNQDLPTHPSPSGQPFQSSGYYPPSSTSRSQQNNAHYPPSSVSKAQSNFPQYLPSSYSQTQPNTGYYPPSSTSKTQHVPSHFPPSSVSKSQQGPAIYPPSSSSKSHHSSSSLLPQPGLAYYPPSSFSKTHHNATSGGHGIHSPLNGKPSLTPQYPPNSHSHGYHSSYVPPSSTTKIHYSVPQPQNTSHSSFHHGGVELGRSVHTPHFPPSSTSKVYHQQGQYGNGGRSGIAQYPPSSTSKLHHSTTSGEHGRPQDHLQGVPQYPPSSASKVAQPGSLYAPQFPPSSTSKVNYPPDNRDIFYGRTPVLERPSAGGNAQEPATHSPSSTSKVHYSPHSHVMAAGGNAHGVQYYPPSSSSKTHYSPSNSGLDHHPTSSYPPSSSSKQHYPHSSRSGSSAQIPQPPIDRNLGFPPSSTSKLHASPSHHAQHYPPSSSGKLPHALGPQSVQSQSQSHQYPVYYPPSATSQLHQTQHNFSSAKELSPSGYYPPSSSSNLHHSPSHHDTQNTGRVTATGRVSLTPGFSYYPPSSSSKNGLVQQGQHVSSGHPNQQYPYYGPSSSSHHRNGSVGHAPSGISPSSPGYESHSPTYYPPSSNSKIHPSQQQNASATDNNMHSKAFYPMEQHPSSSGGQYHPLHRNDSSSGQFSHPSQGGYYSPSLHHSPHGGGYPPQYPSQSTSHHPQQPTAGSQQQFYQGLPPSSQGSQTAVRPCQSSPRSLYSITTRTILTPNGAVQRPVSVNTNGEYPCGGVGQAPGGFPYARYAPCSGTFTRNGQTVRPHIPCTANGNLRKTMRNAVPGPAVVADKNGPQHAGNVQNIRNVNEHYQRGYGNSGGAVITNVETQTELLNGPGHHYRSQFSKLQVAENSTSETTTDDTTGPEYFEESGKSGKDVEVFERNEAEDEKYRSVGKPVKYQENEAGNKTEETRTASEEEVREGDVLEPGDRILGKDGYTILDGFRGRVVSVTGQVGKTRSETGKESRATIPQESEKKSNSGQFRYSSDLGRYVKENEEKNYSNCQGEPTFTCSEFLGSNGRAKICKPNPRRNPDGSPC